LAMQKEDQEKVRQEAARMQKQKLRASQKESKIHEGKCDISTSKKIKEKVYKSVCHRTSIGTDTPCFPACCQ
jgi:hypothetical protein